MPARLERRRWICLSNRSRTCVLVCMPWRCLLLAAEAPVERAQEEEDLQGDAKQLLRRCNRSMPSVLAGICVFERSFEMRSEMT